MWNVTSPHGLPATLNHLHNVMLQLGNPARRRASTEADGGSSSDRSSSSGGGGGGTSDGLGASSSGRRLSSGGASGDRHAYGKRVYDKTAIRVRNHPLPPRGGTSSVAGLMDHLMLALMVALPLSYTTGEEGRGGRVGGVEAGEA
jgi:hypothetical protein